MPISSSNQRLTKELFKPPPKSLVELRISQHQQFHSSGNIDLRHGLSRERHLDGTPPTKPKRYRKKSWANKRRWSVFGNRRSSKVHSSGEAGIVTSANAGYVGTVSPLWGNTACCGYPCCLCGVFTRCGILSLLLGLLLGALITGLVVGLTLYAEIIARDQRIAELEQNYQDCFKDPCPTRSSSCGYATDNTEIECFCRQNETLQALSPAGYIDGYRCTFFNSTLNSTPASMATTI